MTIINNSPAKSLASATEETETKKIKSKELSSDDFIKLFLTQMKNQNPLKPYDSSVILQQMSQLSSMSTAKETQTTLKNLDKNMTQALNRNQSMAATQLIGRDVEVSTPVGVNKPGEGIKGSVVIPAPAKDVTVFVKDRGGNVIKTINCGASNSAGTVDFKWDGLDANGKSYPADYYQIAATANMNGKNYPVETVSSFKVNSVTLSKNNGGAILNLDGIGATPLEDVIKIS